MTRLKKFMGGIHLGPNGVIENLVVEKLDVDPSPVEAGRIWFNTTEGTYKAGHLDGNGSVVVLTLGGKEELDAFIALLASEVAGEGSALVGYAGHDGANAKFSLASGDLENIVDSIVDAIDADRKVLEDTQSNSDANVAAVQSELDNTQASVGLDADGNYVAKTDANYIAGATTIQGATEALDAQAKTNADAIATEQARAEAAEGTLQSNIDQEAADRAAGDTAVQTYVDDNFVNKITTTEQVINAKVTMQDDLYVKGNLTINGGSVTEIVTQELKVGDNVVTLNSDLPADQTPTEDAGLEINRGTEGIMPFIKWDEANDVAVVISGKDVDGNYVMQPIATGGDAAALQSEVNTIETAVGINADGTYTSNTSTNYIASATSVNDSIVLLDSQAKTNADAIATEQARAEAAEGTLQSNIDNEVQRASDAELAIQGELDVTQTGAGLNEDGTYSANTSSNYLSTAVSLSDADNLLDAQVKLNEDAIATEVARATSAEAAVRSELNSTRFTFESTDASTSYTVTHGLNSEMIDVSAWVYDDVESKYFNDDVVISVVDANNIQIDLTSAAKVRVVVSNISYSF